MNLYLLGILKNFLRKLMGSWEQQHILKLLYCVPHRQPGDLAQRPHHCSSHLTGQGPHYLSSGRQSTFRGRLLDILRTQHWLPPRNHYCLHQDGEFPKEKQTRDWEARTVTQPHSDSLVHLRVLHCSENTVTSSRGTKDYNCLHTWEVTKQHSHRSFGLVGYKSQINLLNIYIFNFQNRPGINTSQYLC